VTSRERAIRIEGSWKQALEDEFEKPYMADLRAFLAGEKQQGKIIYPMGDDIFNAFDSTPVDAVKVVILGQDPYHGPHQAQGLSFSVAPGVKIPPSLRNIFKELQRDLGQPIPGNGSLERWARRGVLLLNTSLTVEDGQPASHAKRGWEQLTDALLAEVARTAPACVYMLWGGHAQAKAELISQATAAQPARFLGLSEGPGPERAALVLKANHPSPLSALRAPLPFIGCGHFSQAKAWLAQKNLDLTWDL